MNEQKESTITKLFSILSKPLQKFLMFTISILGINIFSITSILGIISANNEFFNKYFDLILFILIVMIILVIFSLIIISFLLCNVLLRYNPYLKVFNTNLSNCKDNCNNFLFQISEFEKEKKIIEKCTTNFSENLDKLYGLVTEMEIAGNIINKNKLMEIEKNVPPNTDIIIFSSKYRLDKEFKPIIINNIKRGVTYKYIVSRADSSGPKHIKFTQIVEEWHRQYRESFCERQSYTIIKNRSSSKAKQKNANSYISEECDEYFFDHIKEYCSPFENDTLTIMLYRKDHGKNNYSVIVNLPSENEGYYSYILPDNNETSNIIDSILIMCKNEHNYRGDKK